MRVLCGEVGRVGGKRKRGGRARTPGVSRLRVLVFLHFSRSLGRAVGQGCEGRDREVCGSGEKCEYREGGRDRECGERGQLGDEVRPPGVPCEGHAGEDEHGQRGEEWRCPEGGRSRVRSEIEHRLTRLDSSDVTRVRAVRLGHDGEGKVVEPLFDAPHGSGVDDELNREALADFDHTGEHVVVVEALLERGDGHDLWDGAEAEDLVVVEPPEVDEALGDQ
mmetsp:Transcript_19792/g.44868  ORF Transcript_19792/g.44868 Transcript_19792/m.44868 type:complete len:221 (-) Transcript_19792:619-1281(-)